MNPLKGQTEREVTFHEFVLNVYFLILAAGERRAEGHFLTLTTNEVTDTQTWLMVKTTAHIYDVWTKTYNKQSAMYGMRYI